MSGGNLYIENSERWKTMTSIDYLTQFVKAWIAFNAWYRNCYPALEKEKEIIDEIKNRNNKVRDKLISIILGNDVENSQAKVHISNLHNQLEQNPIYMKGSIRITFMNIVIEINQNTNSQFIKNGITYKCTRDPNNWKQITLEVLDRNNTQKLHHIQSDGYNFSEIESLPNYVNLTERMRLRLKGCYEEINPRKPETLLTDNNRNAISIGGFYFIKNSEKIAKAVIEMLYLLRNALFHGEIVPDQNAQKVYEPAYQILRILVESL